MQPTDSEKESLAWLGLAPPGVAPTALGASTRSDSSGRASPTDGDSSPTPAWRKRDGAGDQTVLEALGEVRDAIAALAEEQERRDRLVEAVDAAEQAVTLSRARYVQGVTDFQNVLDAQRSLAELQDQLASSEVAVTSNLIALYRALGGGWGGDLAEDEATGNMATAAGAVAGDTPPA